MNLIPDSFSDPLVLFAQYFAQAQKQESHDATAVALATATADARPAVRMVLLKGVEAEHFVFFTNYESRKGRQLQENPNAALCFHWPTLTVQVRVEGAVSKLSAEESQRYFATRPRGSQIAAWSSQQSAPLFDRAELYFRHREIEMRYADKEIPCPDFWGGYRLFPTRIEFWHSAPFRMHDRLLYERQGTGDWHRTRLFP